MFEDLWSLDCKPVFEIILVFNHFQIVSWLIISGMGFHMKFLNYVAYVSNGHDASENFTNPTSKNTFVGEHLSIGTSVF